MRLMICLGNSAEQQPMSRKTKYIKYSLKNSCPVLFNNTDAIARPPIAKAKRKLLLINGTNRISNGKIR